MENSEKLPIKDFVNDLRKIFRLIFLKKSKKMKNENVMIFQTVVRKYVGIYMCEKS
jgi:hypothetical protein